MSTPIRIAIIANASQAKRELKDVAREGETFGSRLGKVAKISAAAFAAVGAGAVAGAVAVTKSASDSQQSLGATETVFGKYANSVIENSNKAARAVGLSANEYRELSNVTGALLSGAGVPIQRLGGMTDDLNKRAADMAATFGGTTREAVEAISSLLKGEADPIERYGVSIKQADVSARLAAQGLGDLTGEAKKTAEMQARLDLLTQKTAKVQGAFGRESGTLAHQQQVLGAQFENVKAKVGSALLPVLTRAFAYVNDVALPAAEKFGTAMKDRLAPYIDKARAAVDNIKTALEPVGNWFRDHPEVIKGVGTALGIAAVAAGVLAIAMGAIAVASAPITLVVLALAALGGAIAYAYKNSETFRSIVQTVGAKLKEFGGFVTGTVLPAVAALANKIASNLRPVLDAIGQAIASKVMPAVKALTDKWAEWQPLISRIVGVVAKIIAKVVEFGSAVLGKVLPPVIRFAGFLAGALIDAVGSAISIILKISNRVIDFGAKVIDGAKKVGEFATTVGQKIGDVLGWFTSLPGKIKGALSGAGEWLKETGKNIVRGLGAGLDSMWDWVMSKVHALTDKIPGWVKKRLGIASPSKVMAELGKWIPIGLAEGIAGGESAVSAALDDLTKGIEVGFAKTLDRQLDAIKKRHAAAAKKIAKDLSGEKNTKAREKALDANDAAEEKATKAAEKRSRRQQRAITAVVEAHRAAAEANGRALDAVTKALDEAEGSLENAKQAHADYAKSVKDAMISAASIVKIGTTEGVTSVGDMIGELRQKVEKARRWAGLIQRLTEAGLNQTSLDQLIQEGMEGGTGVAEAILAGGAGAIAEINDLTGQLTTVAEELGQSTADTMKQAGIDSAQALVEQLQAEQAAVLAEGQAIGQAIADGVTHALATNGPKSAKAASKLAKQMIKAVKEALGIKSPSKVFRKIGTNVTDGLVMELDPNRVAKSARAMSRALEQEWNTPGGLAGTLSASVISQKTVAIDLHLTADVLDDVARGRQYLTSIDAYTAAGGRHLA